MTRPDALAVAPAAGMQAGAGAARSAAAPYRILLVVRHPVGGIRTFFRYVYRTFDPQRYRFTLICPDLPEARVLLRDLDGLGLEYIPLARQVGAQALMRAVLDVLRQRPFDLVHSHGFTSGLCAIAASLAMRVPHLITCHDVLNRAQFRGVAGPFKKAGLALAMSMMDGIHCVSHDARDNLLGQLRLLGARPGKVRVILNGIETRRFLDARARALRDELGLPPQAFLIGFFGRFMSQKGFAYLVDALARLRAGAPADERGPYLLAFGERDGFYREEQDNVRAKGLSQWVRFLPFEPDIAPTLKGLDLVAMPSLWEACGLVAMEAMVAGVPLVGTDCVGLREVLHGGPARVVPPRDDAALAEAIALEMGSSSRIEAMRYAPAAAARFDVGARAAELEAEMLRHLRKGAARP